MFGKPKPDNNTKLLIEPYLKSFYQHIFNWFQMADDVPDISYDDVMDAELDGSENLNKKRMKTRNLIYKANEEIQLARECTKNIERMWSKGSHLTDKMYLLLSDWETVMLNGLKLDGLWVTSEKIDAKKLAKLQKPYILENRKLGERSQKAYDDVSEEWTKIFPEGFDL